MIKGVGNDPKVRTKERSSVPWTGGVRCELRCRCVDVERGGGWCRKACKQEKQSSSSFSLKFRRGHRRRQKQQQGLRAWFSLSLPLPHAHTCEPVTRPKRAGRPRRSNERKLNLSFAFTPRQIAPLRSGEKGTGPEEKPQKQSIEIHIKVPFRVCRRKRDLWHTVTGGEGEKKESVLQLPEARISDLGCVCVCVCVGFFISPLRASVSLSVSPSVSFTLWSIQTAFDATRNLALVRRVQKVAETRESLENALHACTHTQTHRHTHSLCLFLTLSLSRLHAKQPRTLYTVLL